MVNYSFKKFSFTLYPLDTIHPHPLQTSRRTDGQTERRRTIMTTAHHVNFLRLIVCNC